MKFFISYSSRNRDLVRGLAKDLEDAAKTVSPAGNNEVWFDQELVGGQQWWDTILNAILTCDVFIFALSPHSIKSDPCSRELSYANALNKRIIPILIAGEIRSMDLPELIGPRQYINYTQQDKAAFQSLLSALLELAPAQPLPDPLPAPPAIPLSPLNEISHQLRGDKLDRDAQIDIFYKLRDFAVEPDTAKDARQLLLRLKDHNDVRKAVADDVDAFMHTLPPISSLVTQSQEARQATMPQQTAPPRSQPQPAATAAPARSWLRVNGLTIGLVLGIIVGLTLAQPGAFCYYDYYYGTYYCNQEYDLEILFGAVLLFAGGGWIIDLIIRYIRKSRSAA